MSGKVSDSDPDAWARQLAIGLTTAYLTTRAFLPLVRVRRGSVVFFASAAAFPGGKSLKCPPTRCPKLASSR